MSDTTIDVPSSAVAIRQPEHPTTLEPSPPALWGTTDQAVILEKATSTANVMKGVIQRQGLISRISGREYPRCEAWTLLGTLLGVFPVTSWTREIEGGYEARVEAKTLSGAIVGAAEAICTRKEKNWSSRDDFALKSMAQTRATAKALRMPLGFVMTLAGYEATPAEEMHSEALPSTPPPAANTPPASVPRPSRGELLQTLLVKLCPTDEIRNALTTYLRTVPSKSGRLALLGEEGLEKLDDTMLRYIVSHWAEVWPKVDAWHSGQVPDAEVAPEPGYPYKPKDTNKAHYKGKTLKELFELDPKWAFGIAMNFTAEPWKSDDGQEHQPSPAVVAFARVCEEWREKNRRQ